MNDTRRAVLEAIDGQGVSGADLAKRLDVTRAAVWKHVEALREEGFLIESDNGYRLVSVPEFGASAVEYGLDAPFEIEYHDTIGSTNDRAREAASAGAENLVVLADEQTGSRGRLDREWSAPSGGIWVSPVLRPDIPPAHAPLVTLAAAVATTTAAREAGVDARIKWPNDVLVPTADGDRKLAGILTEMEGEADRISWVVPGIGINANIDVAELPAGATSLRDQVGDVDRRVFTQRVLEALDELLSEEDAILERWRENALTLGQRVRVETASGIVEGEAIDIERPGTLLVDTGSETVRVHAGDCEHLRPA
ncbi:biotin--[acetyl-CoA-carboxylase] ligase [Natranaeroarchaeum sulfidigenes]|uniref:CRISPR-Cas assicated transcriptional regulator, contains CARF and HTH domain n=1 Tax=Natranaeroarchaeum sulfidigenes TaxID=2784880 RepID=A0A897MU72_9EURY|nr:biotin--[acetyl-CoA-carboxylase] ligase [Natranaeroarchaeum sulfidigenes]QSG02593.1 CRISPR-Cas assicated transcriptional regulator, contains CARF and HTH domain [Natranaeroarchaeum sulfidigenes]